MGYEQTPVNGVQIPNNAEKLNQAYIFARKLGTQIEPFTVMRFASMSDLVAKLVGDLTPTAGMIAYINADGSYYGFTGGSWKRIYPTERQIFVGTTTPPASTGAVGDVYFQV